jgi:type II secretory ATPase GspE/PulE/Tfp pilus assembly ATPase PilB-like protein
MAKSAEEKPLHELLPQVTFTPMGAPDKQQNQGNLLAAKQSPVFPIAGGVISHCLSKRGERCLLDFTAQACVVKFEVDGVWMNVDPYDRATGDAMLMVFKKMANLNPQDRRNKQEGKFGVDWPPGGKFIASITSQGVPTGERVLIKILPKKPKFENLEQAGMRDKMREQFKTLMDGDHGLVIISAPPAGGVTTTWRASLQLADRFVRDFVSVESKAIPEDEIINVGQVTFEAGQSPVDVLERLLLKQPDVFVIPDMVNVASLTRMIDQVNTQHRTVITRMAAKDAVEAILRLAAFKPALGDFAKALTCVVNSRLIRKLCEACKQPYQPPPQLLQKLGIPAGRVSTFYKEWTPPPPEQQVDAKGRPIEIPICEKCAGIGYFGRTSIFELLVLNDAIRDVIAKQPNPDLIRRAAKASGHRGLQEEGILLVAQGITSLSELQRVFSTK